MVQTTKIFELEQDGEIVIVVPQIDMGEFGYLELEKDAQVILDQLAQSPPKHLVLDFHKTEYFGSTALSLFVRMWRLVSKNEGQMLLCSLSQAEQDILKSTRLSQIWTVFPDRETTLQAVREGAV
ncbi:MAG: STAS domain-containing protein [Planctomycetales bacterium]